MRDAAHELPDRRELLALEELLGEPPLVGDVADHAEPAGHAALGDDRRHGDRAGAHEPARIPEAHLGSAPLPAQRAREELAHGFAILGLHQLHERGAGEVALRAAHRPLERAVGRHEGTRLVDGEDAIGRRLDEPGVSRFGADERLVALALEGDVARDAEHSHDVGAVIDGCVGDRQGASLAAAPDDATLVAA